MSDLKHGDRVYAVVKGDPGDKSDEGTVVLDSDQLIVNWDSGCPYDWRWVVVSAGTVQAWEGARKTLAFDVKRVDS